MTSRPLIYLDVSQLAEGLPTLDDVTGTLTAPQLVGGGIGLTDLNANNLTSGMVPDARLPATIVRTTGDQSIAGLKSFSANVAAPAFVGSGASLTALNASALGSGTVPDARLPADIVRTSDATYVRTSGDQTIAGNKTFTGNVLLSGGTPNIQFTETDTTAVASLRLTNSTFSILMNGTARFELDTDGYIYGVGANLKAGSAAAPAITFENEYTTGLFRAGTNAIGFSSVGVERMRFASGGSLRIGYLSGDGVSATLSEGVTIAPAGEVQISRNGAGLYLGRTSSDGVAAQFRRNTGNVGNISVTATATAYNTSSDYRLKDDAEWDETYDPLATILAIADAQRFYTWKANGAKELGWYAHELQAIVPEAVTGEKDAEEMQSRDDSKIIKHLVAAVAELTKQLAALKGE